MPYGVNDPVGIIPVRGTGEVRNVPGIRTDPYDVFWDQPKLIRPYLDAQLFPLPIGHSETRHFRIPNGAGKEFLCKCEFSNQNGQRRVKETIYRIVNGHNMGRVPRS